MWEARRDGEAHLPTCTSPAASSVQYALMAPARPGGFFLLFFAAGSMAAAGRGLLGGAGGAGGAGADDAMTR